MPDSVKPSRPLNCVLLDQIRQAINDNNFQVLEGLELNEISPGAAIELVFAGREWQSLKHSRALEFLAKLEQQFPLLRQLSKALGLPQVQFEPRDISSAPNLDIFAISEGSNTDVYNQVYYCHRFSYALKRNGFQNELADGLAAALSEMLDNLGYHSGQIQGTAATGLAVYSCKRKEMCFAVGDGGIGILSSLHRAKNWASLASHRDALRKAVMDNATSRPGFREGTGFKTVYHSIVELDGNLRFRSGNAVLEIQQLFGNKNMTVDSSVPLGGLQLEVSCRLGKPDT